MHRQSKRIRKCGNKRLFYGSAKFQIVVNIANYDSMNSLLYPSTISVLDSDKSGPGISFGVSDSCESDSQSSSGATEQDNTTI